jgi:putative holliday junction resolvase
MEKKSWTGCYRPSANYCQPANHSSNPYDLGFFSRYFNKEIVETVVVGYPKQMNNEASEAVRYINPFLKKFQIQYPDKKLEILDERFTSKMAFQTMIDGGLKKQKRQDKALIDGISATIILQSFLEQKRNKQS